MLSSEICLLSLCETRRSSAIAPAVAFTGYVPVESQILIDSGTDLDH
jgi:hypothetical protein